MVTAKHTNVCHSKKINPNQKSMELWTSLKYYFANKREIQIIQGQIFLNGKTNCYKEAQIHTVVINCHSDYLGEHGKRVLNFSWKNKQVKMLKEKFKK